KAMLAVASAATAAHTAPARAKSQDTAAPTASASTAMHSQGTAEGSIGTILASFPQCDKKGSEAARSPATSAVASTARLAAWVSSQERNRRAVSSASAGSAGSTYGGSFELERLKNTMTVAAQTRRKRSTSMREVGGSSRARPRRASAATTSGVQGIVPTS